MRKVIFSLLVENSSGVLSHIAGLFSRRGYNIDSFSSGITVDARYTRITIVSTGDDAILEQIEKQLAKLEDVISVKRLDASNSVTRELILVKVQVEGNQRAEILSIANIYRAKIVDVSSNSMIIELTGTQSKLNAFIRLLSEYHILELARTGATGLRRGTEDVSQY